MQRSKYDDLFAGTRIYKTDKAKKNEDKNPYTRRYPGSHGYISWELIVDGMSYEKFCQKKGRPEDLEYCLRLGWIKFKCKEKGCVEKEIKLPGPGRSSKFFGQAIYRKRKNNPRPLGTYGYRSWEIIEDGMFYEAYYSAGGRQRDLKWDLDRDWVRVE